MRPAQGRGALHAARALRPACVTPCPAPAPARSSPQHACASAFVAHAAYSACVDKGCVRPPPIYPHSLTPPLLLLLPLLLVLLRTLASPGMDFYVVLERPGYRVARRRQQLARVGVQHRVTKDDAIKWFQTKFEGVVLNKAYGT